MARKNAGIASPQKQKKLRSRKPTRSGKRIPLRRCSRPLAKLPIDQLREQLACRQAVREKAPGPAELALEAAHQQLPGVFCRVLSVVPAIGEGDLYAGVVVRASCSYPLSEREIAAIWLAGTQALNDARRQARATGRVVILGENGEMQMKKRA